MVFLLSHNISVTSEPIPSKIFVSDIKGRLLLGFLDRLLRWYKQLYLLASYSVLYFLV